MRTTQSSGRSSKLRKIKHKRKRSCSKGTDKRAISVADEKINMKTTDKEKGDRPGVNSGTGSGKMNVSNCINECGGDNNLPILSSAAGLLQSGCSGNRSNLSPYDQHPMHYSSGRTNSCSSSIDINESGDEQNFF